jgi:maleylpyruvate isomerase
MSSVPSACGSSIVNPPPETSRRWWAEGERIVAGLVEGLGHDDLAAPSVLPGWTRAHVVAHLARNADALGNLLTWARTGVETPMYASPEARDRDIASTAAQPGAELRADYAAACRRFADAIERLPAEAWTATVRTRQGRAIEATEVPWMRAKEIWVHGTDLRGGLAFGDIPVDFAAALVDDVLGHFARQGEALEVAVSATDVNRQWGSGHSEVSGTVTAIAAWLTRGDASGLSGEVPAPPVWL